MLESRLLPVKGKPSALKPLQYLLAVGDVVRCREDPVTRHGSRGGTAGVLDRKDSTLAQALARRDLRKNEREIETKL